MQSATLIPLLLALAGQKTNMSHEMLRQNPAYETLKTLCPAVLPDDNPAFYMHDACYNPDDKFFTIDNIPFNASEHLFNAREALRRKISNSYCNQETGDITEKTFKLYPNRTLGDFMEPVESEILYIEPHIAIKLEKRNTFGWPINEYDRHGYRKKIKYIDCPPDSGQLITLDGDPSVCFFSMPMKQISYNNVSLNLMPAPADCNNLSQALSIIRVIKESKKSAKRALSARFPMIAAKASELKNFLAPEDQSLQPVRFNVKVSQESTLVTLEEHIILSPETAEFCISSNQRSLWWITAENNSDSSSTIIPFAALCTPETYMRED